MDLRNRDKLHYGKYCYVCGFNFEAESLKEKQRWPFVFCPCCCYEYGIEDFEYDSFLHARENWINKGLRFGYNLNPNNYKWTLDIAIKQLSNLRKVDISIYPNATKMQPNYNTLFDIDEVQFKWKRVRK